MAKENGKMEIVVNCTCQFTIMFFSSFKIVQ